MVLQLKKPLQGKELSVRVIGEQQIPQTYGRRTSYRIERIFDFKQPLDGPKEYSGGPLSYLFKIKIPANVISQQQMPEGMFGKVLKVAQTLSGIRYKTDWYIIARLDVKGFDIAKKVQINIA